MNFSREGDAPALPHPVDARLPLGKLLVLALQHVLTMYAGAVTGPLIIGAALHLPTEQTAYLVSSDLVACGIVTLIQCLGVGPVGVRLPVVMGVTFVAVGPGIAIAADPSLGLPGVFGATIAAGLAGLLIAPVFSRLSGLFAPVVTGASMLLIGVTLMGVAVTWAAGGQAGAPARASDLAVAGLVVATILAVVRFGRGFVANAAVLIGIGAGIAGATATGQVNFTRVLAAPWLQPVAPLHFGAPRFDLGAAASMTLVLLVAMVESSGMMFALGRMVGRPLTSRDLARGLRADAVGAIVGGLFNSFPYTSYAQNVAVVGMTGVRSRYVCAAAGLILILLGTTPKLAFLVTAIPAPALGGAALVMFGMVAASGVETLGRIDFARSPRSLYVVATSLAVGLVPGANPKFFDALAPAAAGLLHNGVMVGIVTAIVLNLLLGGRGAQPAAAASGLAAETSA